MLCIPRLDLPSTKLEAKVELMDITSKLMPSGKPQFTEVIRYPKIADLIVSQGRATMHKLVFLLIKDFCSSVNVVRNMNDDQMIEAAAMLLDECENFRLEDYTMMFAMAKRGQLIKIYDRIDIQVITEILDEYWKRRHRAGKEAQEREFYQTETLPVVASENRQLVFDQKEGYKEVSERDGVESLGGAMSYLKEQLQEAGIVNLDDVKARKEIEANFPKNNIPRYESPPPPPLPKDRSFNKPV